MAWAALDDDDPRFLPVGAAVPARRHKTAARHATRRPAGPTADTVGKPPITDRAGAAVPEGAAPASEAKWCHLCLASEGRMVWNKWMRVWFCSNEIKCVMRARIRLGIPKGIAAGLATMEIETREERRR